MPTIIHTKKLGMSQIYDNGGVVPVTLLQAENTADEALQEGVKVRVTGHSKGKGFQGVVKRWNFAGAPASHGTKHTLRSGGSIGSAFPQHVRKGVKMPGRMGNKKTTIMMRLVKIDTKYHILMVDGPVPGPRGAKVEIRI